MLVTLILFNVKVPVLSEQITLTQPKVSTLGNFLTTLLTLDNLMTPNDKTIVTTASNPLGVPN